MRRLDASSLGTIPTTVGRPAYPVAAAGIGVVHLGVGNFFRAHQAAYLDEAMNAGATGWGVCGVSLRSAATRNALLPQDHYYTLLERDAEQDRPRIIGSLREILVAPEDPQRVIRRMAAPETRWVTLTITEKAYGHVGGSTDGRLDVDHPDIAHDLAVPGSPRSAVGLLHAAILQRRRDGAGPLNVLSCDNLSCNGDLLRSLVAAFDAAAGGRSSAYREDNVRFPNTMVDRIVPRTTETERNLVEGMLGVADSWPVVTEPFRQWVIEDRLAGPRPPLVQSGVQFVADVRPFEAMKLQLLNAAHSALAWLAVPAGLETVDRAVAQPALRRFVETLWQTEVIPGLAPEVAAQAPAYCAGLLVRFANPRLAHRTAQIAMDGSQKLPLRVLPSVRRNLHLGLPIDRLALVVAAWIHYLRGLDDHGRPFVPEDPLAGRLHGLATADPVESARMIVRESSVFGDLAGHDDLTARAAGWLGHLRAHGSLAALAAAGSG